jgi:hypothetical protein
MTLAAVHWFTAAQQVGAKRVEVKVGDTIVTVSFDNDNERLTIASR